MIFSPARAHKNKVAAKIAATHDTERLGESSEHSVMLAALDQQRRSLKTVQSREAKIAMKVDFLREWQGYIDTTLSENSGAHDPIISRLWVWLMDVGNMTSAIDVGRYLLANDLPPPEGFARDTATLFAEEVAEHWLKSADCQLHHDELIAVLEETQMHDMPDEVRAKLQRAVGESLAEEDAEMAICHLSRALELNPKAGCKKQLEALKKAQGTAQPSITRK